MGMIRGALLTFVAVLLFVSLFSMNTTWTIAKSLKYDNIKPELITVINDVIRSQTTVASSIDSNLKNMQLICQNNTEIVQKFEDEVYTIPCDVVGQGSEAVITYVVSDLVEQNYYKEYDCNFWECSYDPPYHLVSAKAQSYWSGWFYMALLVSILLAVGAFFLIENKRGLPFMLGGLVILSALPFVRVSWLLSLLGTWEFLRFFTVFFSKAYAVFITMFVLGLVLIGIGIVLKFMAFGNFLSKLFGGKSKSGKVAVDKEKLKQEIKEEIKAEKKDSEKPEFRKKPKK